MAEDFENDIVDPAVEMNEVVMAELIYLLSMKIS